MSVLSPSRLRQGFSTYDARGLGIPVVVLAIMAMLVVPLPAFVLDVLFTFNIVVATVIIMIAIGVRKPLDFSSFPAILLFATMLRLALNVASTRVILVSGHEGEDSAGQVIAAFGEFVIAGNYLVGFIIFVILMIVNFVVVTKGAGRVSEVNARFTLDAMPGKRRREELSQEADFFGSMDGASKFVSGDAIAGLAILVINLVGGVAIGVIQHDMNIGDSARVYALLTIGDGLVAQIPALFLSLATAIIVTRVTTTESMTEQASTQLANPSALFLGGGMMGVLGLIPGMPHAVFLLLSGVTVALGFMALRGEVAFAEATQPAVATPEPPKELDWDDVEQVDLIGLEIGYGLIPLVNAESGGQLMARVRGVRKKLSVELGFVLQPVRIRDSLSLDPSSYRILVNGAVRGRGEVKTGRELAINPGSVYGSLEGVPTREPAFGLEAVWIDPSQRDYARGLGYTVVDPATAIATHLNKVMRESAAELLSHDETQKLLDKLATRFPKLVEELVPGKLPLGVVTRTLQHLLLELVPIRDMRTVVEALADASARTHDPEQLAGFVRTRLGRMIIQGLLEDTETLSAMTLDPSLEQLLHNILQQNPGNTDVVLEPALAESLFTALRENVRNVEAQGTAAVLVVSPAIRPWLSRAVRHRVNDLTVLSYSEIPEEQSVKIIATVAAELRKNPSTTGN
jgi:flagellar biosynthesis protein FlhA